MRGTCLFLAVLVLCGCSKSEGRYELREGIHERHFMDANGNVKTLQPHGIFKLDTVTGRTWVYRSMVLSGPTNELTVETWEEIK